MDNSQLSTSVVVLQNNNTIIPVEKTLKRFDLLVSPTKGQTIKISPPRPLPNSIYSQTGVLENLRPRSFPQLLYLPNNGELGVDSFSYTGIEKDTNAVFSYKFDVIIKSKNELARSITSNQTLEIQIPATESFEIPTVEISPSINNGRLTRLPGDSTLSYKPRSNYVGNDLLSYYFQDDINSWRVETVFIQVTPTEYPIQVYNLLRQKLGDDLKVLGKYEFLKKEKVQVEDLAIAFLNVKPDPRADWRMKTGSGIEAILEVDNPYGIIPARGNYTRGEETYKLTLMQHDRQNHTDLGDCIRAIFDIPAIRPLEPPVYVPQITIDTGNKGSDTSFVPAKAVFKLKHNYDILNDGVSTPTTPIQK